MASHEHAIRLEITSGVATLTIDNQSRRNAINQRMWQQLVDHLISIDADPAVRVVVLTGAGEKAFSAGADIHEFSELSKNAEKLRASNVLVQRAQILLEELPRPTIALLRGSCFGGGCGLALACDFRYADSSAKFAITPAKLGLLYSLRDTQRLINTVGAVLAKELIFTGRSMSADEAFKRGLINKLCGHDTLATEVNSLATDLVAASQYSIRGMKKIIADLGRRELTSRKAFDIQFDEAFSAEDGIEGARAFCEKRPPKFTFE